MMQTEEKAAMADLFCSVWRSCLEHHGVHLLSEILKAYIILYFYQIFFAFLSHVFKRT